MVWGCMTSQGPGYITQIEGIMDKNLYKEISSEDGAQRYIEILQAQKR